MELRRSQCTLFIEGSWDNFNQNFPWKVAAWALIASSSPIPSAERVEYKFHIDGLESAGDDLPRVRNEQDILVNVEHSDPTVFTKASKVHKIISNIWGVDLYSPLKGHQFASMLLFRFFSNKTIASAYYYFLRAPCSTWKS